MSDTEKCTMRSTSPYEAKSRKKFTDFSVKPTEYKHTHSAINVNYLLGMLTFENMTIAYATISVFCSYFLILIPTIFSSFVNTDSTSIFYRSLSAPFLSVYKSYCTLTLDPFICKVYPGWMYAPRISELLIQVPLLKLYFYYLKHPDKFSLEFKTFLLTSYSVTVFVKTLPILFEIFYNENIENKSTLAYVYGTDILISGIIAVALLKLKLSTVPTT